MWKKYIIPGAIGVAAAATAVKAALYVPEKTDYGTATEEKVDAKISFSEESYTAKDGFVTVVLKREGALNQVVGATLTSVDGTATAGKDYSQVNTQVIFPVGIKERRINIPVNQEIQTGVMKWRRGNL